MPDSDSAAQITPRYRFWKLYQFEFSRQRDRGLDDLYKVKTEARFGLASPSYLLGPYFEAVIGPIEPVEVIKKQMYRKKLQLLYKTAGSAAVKKVKIIWA